MTIQIWTLPIKHETQQSITQWADETFGKITDFKRALVRLKEELDELQEVVDYYTQPTDIGIPNPLGASTDIIGELADVIIVASRIAQNYGLDIQQEVDVKMSINRQRKWRKDGTGHGYHVKEDEQDQ